MDELLIEVQADTENELEKDIRYQACKIIECPIDIISKENPAKVVLRFSKPDVYKVMRLLREHRSAEEMMKVVLSLFPELLKEMSRPLIRQSNQPNATMGSILHDVLWDRNTNEKTVLLLLELGVDPNSKDTKGSTPLHLCAQAYGGYNTSRYAKELIEHGADVNARNNEGDTPLHTAVIMAQGQENKAKMLTVVDLLIEHGADTKIKNNDGCTPSAFISTPEIRERFEKLGERMNLRSAVAIGSMEQINKLLEAGADVNECDGEGFTLLYTAIENNQPKAVEVLLTHGANPNTLPNKPVWLSPLQMAAMNNQGTIAKLLVDHGADPNVREPARKMTALEIAHERGASSVIQALNTTKKTATPQKHGDMPSPLAQKPAPKNKAVNDGFAYKLGKLIRKLTTKKQ
jgi:ankyrin repeat protein